MNFYKHESFIKQAQLQKFAERLKKLAQSGGFFRLSKEKQNSLISRLRRLQRQLLNLLPEFKLSKAFAISTLALGLISGKTDAQVSFAPPISNPFGLAATGYYALPSVADLDNDGDIDLTIGALGYYNTNFVYWKNIGIPSAPNFVSGVDNPLGGASFSGLSFLSFGDMDNDGDYDALMSAGNYYSGGRKFLYFQNVGDKTNPLFLVPEANPFDLVPYNVEYFASLVLADLDSDGDMDLITGEYYGLINYYQNIGTPEEASFAAPITNPFGIVNGSEMNFPALADLDYDGDLDIFSGGDYYGRILYYENTGTPTSPAFGVADTMPFGIDTVNGLGFPAFGDMDGDSDLDLIVGGYYGEINYFENTSPVSRAKPIPGGEMTIYPNPASDHSTLVFSAPGYVDKFDLVLMNTIGQTVLEEEVLVQGNTLKHQINLKGMSPGIYFVRIESKKGILVKKLIVR